MPVSGSADVYYNWKPAVVMGICVWHKGYGLKKHVWSLHGLQQLLLPSAMNGQLLMALLLEKNCSHRISSRATPIALIMNLLLYDHLLSSVWVAHRVTEEKIHTLEDTNLKDRGGVAFMESQGRGFVWFLSRFRWILLCLEWHLLLKEHVHVWFEIYFVDWILSMEEMCIC